MKLASDGHFLPDMVQYIESSCERINIRISFKGGVNMTIPKYDEMYRAFLDCLTDGQPHKSKEVKDTIAEVFHLSDEERAVLLPSGSGPVFDGRVGWTRTYLKKAGLIQSPSRGIFALTPAGKQMFSARIILFLRVYLKTRINPPEAALVFPKSASGGFPLLFCHFP